MAANFVRFLLIMALFLTLTTTSCSDDKAAYYYRRSVGKQNKGDLDGAIADCTKAIQLKPDLEKR